VHEETLPTGVACLGSPALEMNSLLAILLPVALFAAQAWFAVALDLTEVLGVYQVFLVSYLVGAGVGVARPPREQARDELAPSFDAFARNFIWAKVVLTIYFALIFLGYVRQGGFASVRHFMTSEEIQTSPFYFPPFMYVDAYLMYPLNYIVLVALFLRRNWKYFLVLLCSILLHNAVFYAGRTVFYNLLMLALFGALYRRESVLKTLAGVTAAAVIGPSRSPT